MALIRVYGATVIGLVLLFGVNFVDSTSCYKCTSAENAESCGIELKDAAHCTVDGDYNNCMTYQYTLNDSIVTVRDCPDDNYNCKSLYADGKNDSLLMCNECHNDFYCNGNIDTSNNTCAKCNSLDSKDCKDTIEDVGENTCFLDSTVNTECFVYKYKGDSSTVTVRGCGRSNSCDTLRDECKDTLEMCDECTNTNGSNCNQNIAPSETCVKCNSLEQPGCENGTIDTSVITDTCDLDSTVNTECITYKYEDANSSTIVTVRDCASKDTCNSFLSDTYKDTLVMCHECDTPNCNQNLDLPTCVECNSLQDANCSQSKIDTTITTGVCYLDSIVNFECITYQYLEKDSSTVTVRGCAPDKNCEVLHSDTYKDALLMCDECSDDSNCNQEFDTTKTCIECNSENNPDCASVQIDPSINNVTCYSDQTVKNECVIYKYRKDDSTEVTIRDCAPKDYCKTLLDDSLIMCNHCTGNNCNSEILNSKKCVQCNSIDEPKCADDIVDTKTVTGTCDLDDAVNVQCVSYKYLQDGHTHIYRGCGSENYCDHAWSNTTACTSCTDNDSDDNKMCNSKVKFENGKTLCIQCTSEDDDECKKDDMNSSKIKNYCPLDDDNSECVAYKYLNPLNGEIEINRGCAPVDYCKVLEGYSNTTVCDEGTNMIYNKKIDTSNEEILCVKCDTDKEGSTCAADEVDLNYVDFCKITNTDKIGCFVNKYLESSTGKMHTERGCEASSYCENQQDTDNTALCSVCHGEICNRKINATTEKSFCVECDGEEGTECGKDTITDLSQVGFCVLNSNVDLKCVAHRYLDAKSGKIKTHRGCAPEDYCKKSESSTTIVCKTCEENDKYCNKDIDKNDEKTLCVKCDSEADDSECSKDTVDLSKVDFCGIASAEEQQCVTHKYLNVETNKFSTHRGCEPKDYCAQYNTSGTILCDECKNGNNCNMANIPTSVTLCVQCNSEDGSECTDTTSDLTKVEFCKRDSTNDQCVAYRYIDVTSGNVNTYRGCEAENYCNQQNNSTKIICSECDGDNNCNMKIDTDKEKTLCVSCEGEACASNSVDLKQVGFCELASSDTNRCVARRYVDVTSGNVITYRGCEAENYCAQYNHSDTALICDECTTGLCNKIIENEDALCVECSTDEGSECAADTITDFSKVNFCKITSTNKLQCVTHRYLNVSSGKISTHRGCELDTYCDNQSTDSQMAMICSKCTSTDTVCNIKIDTSKEQTWCIDCTGEEGTNCANNPINDLSQAHFCTLTDNQQCVTYKYLDEKTNKIDIKRGCENTNFCDTYKNQNNTLICDECQDEICNINTVNEGKIICVQCSGEEESDCGKNTVDLAEVNSCIADSTDNAQQCVYHKYLNVTTGKYNIYRGCGAEDYCTQQNGVNNGSTALCKQCNDNDHCNMNIDTSEELTLCVFCEGEEGSDCAAASVDLTKMSFCGISPENEKIKKCMSYRYVEGSTNRLTTVRGCEERNCSNLVVDDGKVQQCSECFGDICNVYLEIITTTTVPPTTTSGAASIIQYKFNELFLYLFISVLFFVH